MQSQHSPKTLSLILCVAGRMYQCGCQVHFLGACPAWDMGWWFWGQCHWVSSSRGPVHCSLPKEAVGDLPAICKTK